MVSEIPDVPVISNNVLAYYTIRAYIGTKAEHIKIQARALGEPPA